MQILHNDTGICLIKGGENEAWEKIDAFPLKPTIIVHTGGGLHLYFLLNASIAITPDLVLDLEALNKAYAGALGGDHCHSLEHILRIPGTVNWPDAKKRRMGRVRAPVRLLLSDGSRYTLEQLQEAFGTSSTQADYETAREHNQSHPTTPSIPRKFLALLEQDPKLKATWEGNRTDPNWPKTASRQALERDHRRQGC